MHTGLSHRAECGPKNIFSLTNHKRMYRYSLTFPRYVYLNIITPEKKISTFHISTSSKIHIKVNSVRCFCQPFCSCNVTFQHIADVLIFPISTSRDKVGKVKNAKLKIGEKSLTGWLWMQKPNNHKLVVDFTHIFITVLSQNHSKHIENIFYNICFLVYGSANMCFRFARKIHVCLALVWSLSWNILYLKGYFCLHEAKLNWLMEFTDFTEVFEWFILE